MILVTLLWSIAGVVTRHLEAARSFEVTFWRSAFNAVALAAGLAWLRGPRTLAGELVRASWPLWLSSVCWAVMFTAFMVAITLTTVANVLITLALAPLFTALAARLALGQRLPARTWGAIAAAGAGIAWMFHDAAVASHGALLGMPVALAVPLAAATNWTLMQHAGSARKGGDMLPAVLVGAVLSALAALPLALPLGASAHDLMLLGLLGVVQLAVPCLLAVRAARELPAPEVALLALLEVIFGVLWAWLGAGETPSGSALAGGSVVLLALGINEALGMRARASPT